MKFMISIVILALVATSLTLANEQPRQQVAANQPSADRQGRSVSGNSNSGNSLHQNGNSNFIDHNSSKARIELERRQVQEFMTLKNLAKSIVKLVFGNQDEISATSRHVLGILGKVLDILKNTFGQKSRSGTARTIRDTAEDAANAGVSMLQGYVRSMLAQDDRCVQRYLCQASKEATRDSRDLGYVIASVGGYASSYLLDNSKSANFKSLYDAALKGRSANEDCAKHYPDCPE